VCRAPKSQSESAEAISQAWFQGVEYCREINVYDEIAWPVIEERWAVDMIRSVFKLHFPQEGECVMKPLIQKDPHGSHVTEITVICNDAIQFKDDPQKSTWKEIIVTKEPLRLQVFNLVSHARRMFRSLVYTSNQKFSLHSLSSVDRKLDREIFFKFKDEAGSFKKRVANESTLEVDARTRSCSEMSLMCLRAYYKALFLPFYSKILIFGWELMRFCEARQVARCIGLITALKQKSIRVLSLAAPPLLVARIGNFQESVPTPSRQRFFAGEQ
jgi:hypothetical protein